MAAQAASRDDDFIGAREAFRVGDPARLEVFASRLKGYPLEPYVAYWQARMRLEDADAETVRAFLARYPDTAVADRLRTEWLKLLGRRQRWELFHAERPPLVSDDTEIVCYGIQARPGFPGDREVLKEAKPLWLTGREQPDACGPVFDALVTAGLIDQEDVWARLRLALENGQAGLAKRVNQYLPNAIAVPLKSLDAANDNPQRYLDRQLQDLRTRAGRELALFALGKIAKTNSYQAREAYLKLKGRLPEADRRWFMGQLAAQAARRHQPEALDWFAEAGTAPGDAQLAWKVRAALRARDWQAVAAAVDAMSAEERAAGAWRYWKGRALKVTGRVPEANAVLAPLSVEFNFYGLLAGEELGVAIGAPADDWKPTEEEVRAVAALPGIQRAVLLFELGMRVEGTREWNWTIREFSDPRLIAAAEVARRNQLWDRAINTADKTREIHDFSLRYLAPYRELMQENARQFGLDEAWMYGLVRQESRFIGAARSSAGASGLMQLMPATAKWVAGKLGMKNYQPARITDLDTNVAMGAYYLKHVLTVLDNHPVLASAAYNAGPGRARQWRDDRPMEGAVYAESIPFTETRDYVKKVMANAVHYAGVFGQPGRSLRQRLGVIGPRGAETEPPPEE